MKKKDFMIPDYGQISFLVSCGGGDDCCLMAGETTDGKVVIVNSNNVDRHILMTKENFTEGIKAIKAADKGSLRRYMEFPYIGVSSSGRLIFTTSPEDYGQTVSMTKEEAKNFFDDINIGGYDRLTVQ